MTMDYLMGDLLLNRIKKNSLVKKDIFFHWLVQLLEQLELFHRYGNQEVYRYLNPYSMMVTQENQVFLLDLEAKENEFVLKNLQMRGMRQHFLEPFLEDEQREKESVDIFCVGKIIQFILAQGQIEPRLSKTEEQRFAFLIEKCLNHTHKKHYKNLVQIKKDLLKIN